MGLNVYFQVGVYAMQGRFLSSKKQLEVEMGWLEVWAMQCLLFQE
jgi:hypothetical protein